MENCRKSYRPVQRIIRTIRRHRQFSDTTLLVDKKSTAFNVFSRDVFRIGNLQLSSHRVDLVLLHTVTLTREMFVG